MAQEKSTIRLALDWTPNTIHSGLYIASATKLYSDVGLDVQLLPPDPDYTLTPAKRLERGEVDLAICPSESVIAYAESDKPGIKLEAIYAILQKDASAIVSASHQTMRLRDLESGKYGSYNARYEDHIVRCMVDADGGDGSKVRIAGSKGKLSLFEEMKMGNVDATWIFLPWEGTEAQMEALALNIFRTEDYGVPYGYSPVIARNAARSLPDDVLVRFVKATRTGYKMAIEDAARAVQVLKNMCDPPRSEDFLLSSQEDVNGFYSDGSELGSMKLDRWRRWLAWLKGNKLVAKHDVQAEDLFTNEFISKD